LVSVHRISFLLFAIAFVFEIVSDFLMLHSLLMCSCHLFILVGSDHNQVDNRQARQ
jgi:hypothetical protein